MRGKYGLELGTGYEIANNAMRIPFNTGLGYYYGTELGAGLGLDQTAQRRIGTASALSSGLASTATFMDSLWKRREAKDRNAYLQSLDYTNQPYDRYGYQSYLGGPSQPNYFRQGGQLPTYQEAGEVPTPSEDELWQNYQAVTNYRQQLSDQLNQLEQERQHVQDVRTRIPEEARNRVGNTRTRTRLPQGFYCNTRSCEVIQDAGARVARPTKSVRNSGMYQQGEPMPIIPGNQSFLARANNLGFQEVQNPEAGDLVQWLSYPDMTPTHSVIYAGQGMPRANGSPTHDYYSDPGTGNVYKYVDNSNMPGDRKVWRYVGRTPEIEQEYNQLMSQGQQYLNLQQPPTVTLPSLQSRVAYSSPGNVQIQPQQYVEPLPDIVPTGIQNLDRRMMVTQSRVSKTRSGEPLYDAYMNKKEGGLIKRADGSYSERGLWDNIRANIGSGKKPTKKMLEQEKKIMEEGGTVRNGTTKRSTNKGKKMAVYMDGSWHHFGDSSMDDYRTHKSEKRKEAFYSRHKKNLQGDSPRAKAFRVYAKKTWQDGGMIFNEPTGFDPNLKPCYKCGGKVKYQEGGDVDFYDSDPEQLYINHVDELPQELSVTEFELPAHAAYMRPQDLPRPQISTAPKGGSIAVTHNNPGNIKYGEFAQQFGASPGRQATDGGIFAVFPDVETGLAAQRRLLLSKNYKNLTVNQAMKRWSNSGYGGELYPSIANKTMAQLTEAELKELQRRQIKREDGNMYRAIYGE